MGRRPAQCSRYCKDKPTQSPAPAEVSLMLRSASSTWGIRRPKWMSSHSVATWCQMSMSSSPLSPGGCPYLCQVHGEKLWQRRFSHPSAAPPLPCHPHQQDAVLLELIDSRQVCALPLESPRAQWPGGTVARVLMSIRTKLQNKEHVIEALRRAKSKFPGRQKIHISKKWGFTKFNADEFENMVATKRLIPNGCGV